MVNKWKRNLIQQVVLKDRYIPKQQSEDGNYSECTSSSPLWDG